MTGPAHRLAADTAASAAPAAFPEPLASVGVLDTSEIRWFGEGPLPPELVEWFTAAGGIGLVNERWDAYRASGAHAVGMKHRDGHLEMKVRRSVDGLIRLADGVVGHVEEWSKFRPTRSRRRFGRHARWTDVHKVMITRNFGFDDAGAYPVARPDGLAAGCEIELTSVVTGDLVGWTFALEAFGHRSLRVQALQAAWTAFELETPLPAGFASRLGHNLGYPGWLNTFVWGAGGAAAR